MVENFLNNDNVLNIYAHGSRVYKTNTTLSDYDYILIVNKPLKESNFSYENEDFVVFTKQEWEEMALDNNCDFLECIFLEDNFKLKETFIPKYTLDFNKIRGNFSKKASNSFVKCKKKLEVEKDFNPYIAKKSLFHSLRLLQFGIQILKYGKITDYSCCNNLFTEIMNEKSNDWKVFKEKYQKIYNKYKSEFRAFDNCHYAQKTFEEAR